MALYPFFRDSNMGSLADTMRQMISMGDNMVRGLDEPTRAFMRESSAMANTSVDVKETATAFQFVADLPGLSREEVKVQLEDGNTLVISGERHRETKEGEPGAKYHRMERSTGKFMRRFTLPQNVEVEKIGAQCKDGLLTVTVPKAPPKEPEKPKEEEEKLKEVDEEEEGPPLQRSSGQPSSNTGGDLEKRISEWVANLTVGEEEEVSMYIPQDQQEAAMKAWEVEKDPLKCQALEDEKRMEWKLAVMREKKRRIDKAAEAAEALKEVKNIEAQLAAQPDLPNKMRVIARSVACLARVQADQYDFSRSQDIAVRSIRLGFRDFARELVGAVGVEVGHRLDKTERFCAGAIEGVKAAAPKEEEARPPRREPGKVKFPDSYSGKREENFDNWEANVKTYVHLQQVSLDQQVLIAIHALRDEAANFARSLAYFRLEKYGKVEKVLHSLTLFVEDSLLFDIVLGMDWGEAAGATLHLKEHECRLLGSSGEAKTTRLFHVSGAENSLAHCCLSAPSFTRLVKKEKREEQVFIAYVRPVTEPKEEKPVDPAIAKLLEEFEDLTEPPTGTVPRPIQHRIEIEPGSRTPKGAVYRMSPRELEDLRKQLDELLEKG
ncbi:hypothetical protein CBR_g56622 [Chara braunii]|uniref:SHSP domain-containing protein n=1 Tax=Chara braunii TaxID=69332 RepID=A0A388MDL9_CHABU|nr:hypothetical protein CBR_g56622 [Chara braunii]|eukprot:GBG92657.1 hypothetical protein CBR_g56622 [Chara braunii]